MNKTLRAAAPAKINLSLEIIDKFPNGFHKLVSVMQTVSLFDFLNISVSDNHDDNEIILRGNSSNIPYNEKNIVYKVLKSYLDCTCKSGYKIEVYIEKNIPTEAGLAGGSTDGAAALIGINKLFDNALSDENIHSIAAENGSDLNFCLVGGTCVLSSRGEIIEEKLPHQDYKVVIVKPKNIAVSTPQCYKDFSQKYFEKKEAYFSPKISEIFKSDFSTKKLSEYLYNDLERPAIDMFAKIEEIKKMLISSGCHSALMSGSGSSVFGLYEGNINIPQDDDLEIFYVKSLPDGVKILN